jgi:BNR/Asp-box repeat
MHFISQDTGWVCGRAPNDSGGLILYTTDGGATWETVHNTQINHDYVWKLQRLDAQNWFASIEREPVAGAVTHMLKSVDGGLTWSAVLVKNTVERMQAIGFVTPLRGWAGDQKLFETKDGGLTWQNINTNNSIGSNFNRFVRMSANKAFMSGSNLHQFLDGAAAAPEPNLAGGDFHRLAVSPNPASSSVQIQVTLKQRTQVMLRLYRFDGRYEEILWQGDQQPGDYILPIDLTHKASGTYIVYLKTHHGVQYEKLVKP